MRLEWSEAADADRWDLFSFVELDSPRTAAMLDNRLVAGALRLTEFPYSGRIGRVVDTRELVVTGTPYIAIYITAPDAVVILRVLHAAQAWPP
ncbi:type II toxin-antitoxin system RelE/ParE family toxin [Devosia sp. Root635]|uniref:type II toxin-antitoxin system RelE/ParE family toxin n=1 Tax=Devosia sp. Root635 TaxID=1736575 RepID=UPI000701A696|nr:type II toxin-antitoxin system RelE/ParE family toxin [Devosia sp. Root635]KRA41701.1 addiction module toxin RelE [Devosia sp. Root635]